MEIIMDMLKNKGDVLKFLLETIESSSKMSNGMRKLSESHNQEFKLNKLLEVISNQSIQIKHLSLLLLIYSQSSDFDGDMAFMLSKMGHGEEALKQMFKNKFKNGGLS